MFLNLQNVLAQDNSEKTTLFKYVAPIKTSEDNQQNIFKNFPVFIGNAQMIDLFDYAYLGVNKSRKQARS